jgi:hypothetical protein
MPPFSFLALVSRLLCRPGLMHFIGGLFTPEIAHFVRAAGYNVSQVLAGHKLIGMASRGKSRGDATKVPVTTICLA